MGTGSSRFTIDMGDTMLVGDSRAGDGAPLVFLHAGVCDRRSWRPVCARLDDHVAFIAYDRRAYGESLLGGTDFTHLADLIAVLEAKIFEPAWLIGSSMGGAVALDCALTRPDLVRGLVLFAPAVSGAPDESEGEMDPATSRLVNLMLNAVSNDAFDEINRLETHLWLDGPASAEGRVDGEVRQLVLDMNRIALVTDLTADDELGASGVDAWAALEELDFPTHIVWGELDVPFVIERSRSVAERISGATSAIQPGVAHLGYLEEPDAAVAEIAGALKRS